TDERRDVRTTIARAWEKHRIRDEARGDLVAPTFRQRLDEPRGEQLVLQRQVEEHVDGIAGALLGELVQRPSDPRLVLRMVHRVHRGDLWTQRKASRRFERFPNVMADAGIAEELAPPRL